MTRQRQQARVHRPVSYPPRLNHSQAVLSGVDENNLLLINGNNRMASIYHQVPSPLHSSQSQLSSSTSTSIGKFIFTWLWLTTTLWLYSGFKTHVCLETPYGSQQHLQGSQNNLHNQSYQPQMNAIQGIYFILSLQVTLTAN